MYLNNIDARSLKGRARIFIIILVFTAAFFLSALKIGADEPVSGRKNFLRTSYNPDYYSLFEINGDMLYARGKYTDDRIKKIFFAGLEDETGSYKMSVKGDGSYEAEISLPSGYSYISVCITLSSGAAFGYRINYSNGWFFPDNGLSEKNKTVFDNITEASPESTGYYLSPDAEAGEITAVLEQIKRISDSVTDGLETDYEKARALSVYVAKHFYYDHDARASSVTEENIALSEVLRTARTVCTGFADLYCALLQAQDIDAVNIKGGSTGGEIEYENLTDGVQNHEFTAFYYEAEQRWVWVDCCWNGSGDYENGEFIEDNAHEKYFDISDEALALDHRADYAQRRSFFKAVPAADTQILTDITEESLPETAETTSKESVLTEPTTTAVPEETAEEQKATPAPEEDNTVLVIIAALLGAAVTGMGIFIIIRLKKG